MDADKEVAADRPVVNGEAEEEPVVGKKGKEITSSSQNSDSEMPDDERGSSEKSDDEQIQNDSCKESEKTNGGDLVNGDDEMSEEKDEEMDEVKEKKADSESDETSKDAEGSGDADEAKDAEDNSQTETSENKTKDKTEDKTDDKTEDKTKEKGDGDAEKDKEASGDKAKPLPTKNLRKRKSANGYKEEDTSSDEDYADMIIEKKQKTDTGKTATEKSVNVPVAALDSNAPVVPLALGQSVSLVGTNLLQNQQVRMVIPSGSSGLLTSTGQPLLISQPQTSLLNTQAITLNPAGVVLYPQLQSGSASAVMSSMITTAAQKVSTTNSSVELSIVGVSNANTSSKNGAMVTSVTTVNNKAVANIEKMDLRPPNNSQEMIELVKWELKQGVYHRPKNFRVKPDSELGPMARFLRDFGQDLVKESVYSDLVSIQSRRSDHGKLSEKEKKDFYKLKSVHSELKEKIGPVKTNMSRMCRCGFKTESSNVMYWHKQHPHVKGSDLKCALCDFDTREPPTFTFHMEAEHNRKPRYVEKPAFWSCNLCPYETNLRNKLTQHRFKCMKTFKLSLNLHPAWLPGPEANYCLEKIFYKNPVIANMNRMQQQQQQQQQQRPVMPIMPKGPAQQVGAKPSLIGKPIVKKSPGINPQTMRNPALMAKLGQNIGKQQQRPAVNFTPNINMFQGQKSSPSLAAHLLSAANLAKKSATSVTYVRQPSPNVSAKVNSIIGANNQVVDKGQNNKPVGFEVCEICGGYVKDRTALRIHFFYAHRIDMPHGVFDRVHPPLYCATCFARFWTAQGLQKHLDVHKEDSSGGVAGKCIVCLHRVPNILMHMKIVHNKAFVNFLRECKCIFCGLKFPSKTVVESHMAAVHGVVVKSGAQPQGSQQAKKQAQNNKGGQKGGKNDLVKGSVCVLCNLNFGRNVDLTRHCMRVHHTCMKCGMVVADKESLLKHSCLESPSGLRNCEICKEKGFHPAYHVKHIRDKHLRKLSIKLRRLDQKVIEKWTGRPMPMTKKPAMPTETIELSDSDDDEEPYAKRVKVDPNCQPGPPGPRSSKINREARRAEANRKKADEVVTLTDDDDKKDEKGKKNKDAEKSASKDETPKDADKDSKKSVDQSDDSKSDKDKESKKDEKPSSADREEKMDVSDAS